MHFLSPCIMALFAGAMASPLSGESTNTNLVSRDFEGDITCEGFDEAEEPTGKYSWDEGMSTLKSMTDDGESCSAPAGGCNRVSCSNDGAIYLCNETEDDRDDVKCSDIAETVKRIIEECTESRYPRPRTDVIGWQGSTDGMKVHIGKNEC